MHERLISALGGRVGHFELESGCHSDIWFDLDAAFERSENLRPFARALADRLSEVACDVVCGPESGGAILARMIASELGLDFVAVERVARPNEEASPAIDYRIAESHRAQLAHQRTIVIDDVISAGTAVRATLAELSTCGAKPTALAALLAIGESAREIAVRGGLSFHALAMRPSGVWPRENCPLCQCGVPLIEFPAH